MLEGVLNQPFISFLISEKDFFGKPCASHKVRKRPSRRSGTETPKNEIMMMTYKNAINNEFSRGPKIRENRGRRGKKILFWKTFLCVGCCCLVTQIWKQAEEEEKRTLQFSSPISSSSFFSVSPPLATAYPIF